VPLLSDRVAYQAFVDRPRLHLPGGARICVWPIVNVEEWRIDRNMPRNVLPPPMGQPLMPNVPNWAWHEYGMRVGFWRHLKAFSDRGIRATLAINGRVCIAYPRVARAAFDAGWEFMGHGFEQRPQHSLDDEAAAIRDTVEAIRAFTGKPPVGWESPGLTETENTLDLLKEHGIDYVANWPFDDLPVEMETAHGPIWTLPYPIETNDIVIHVVQEHHSPVFFERGRDTFARLYAESADNAKIMGLSLHPYITGVPHRIGQVEALLDHISGHDGVVFMTGDEILDWYRSETAKGGS
jgi:peptidoglycan/xylan/chitin deacetylase (PgdA/CDA1 family)